MRLLKILLASLSFLFFVYVQSVDAGGPAAYYSSSFTVEWWENVVRSHARWGNAIDEWQLDSNGFYCVHPDKLVGEVIWLKNADGLMVSCTIGDSVKPEHEAAWRGKWAVEVSWNLFVYLDLDRHNYVEVYFVPSRPTEWYFEETGYNVSGALWKYWDRFGDHRLSVELLGYPLGEAYVEPDTGLLTQRFERAVLEATSEGYVRGQRVGVDACQVKEAKSLAKAMPENHLPDEGKLFSETGFAVSGDFLAFWDQFGDLSVSTETFGYPVSSEMWEDGLLVQCFERAVFEQHADGVVLLRRIVAEQF